MLLELLTALPLLLPVDTPARPPARTPAQWSDSAIVYHGRAGQLTIQAPRADADIAIDGRLDEPVWQHSAVLADFSQYQPVDGLPAEDSTEVLVWYSPDAIYFGIRARERHGPVHATLADRDRIDGEDFVQILLDTFHDGRHAFVFGVNPVGIQSDGIRSEGAINAGNGADQTGLDLSPDFVWQSHGRVTADGYEVEIRIPFKSIRYRSAGVQSWGINVIRQVQHSGYQLTWTPARRASASFLSQSGTLEGLSDLHRGLVLDLNPVATTRIDGAPASTPAPGTLGPWHYATSPEVGGNVRWGVTPNLALTGTGNPDFSQVEADAGQIITDPRQALFFPEKRPFFLEGIEQFGTPDQLIYTRRIVNPRAAAKLTGKEAGDDIGLLSAVDDVTGDDGVVHHPVFNLLRLRRDLGAQSTAGLTYTDRVDGSGFNRVLGADTRIYFKKLYFAQFSVAGSLTRDSVSAPTRAAPLWDAVVDRTGRSFGFHYAIAGSHPDFQAQSGFLGRTGTVHAIVFNRFTTYGRPRALLESYSLFVEMTGLWEYDRFTAGRIPDDALLHFENMFTLRGGWGIDIVPMIESFNYPEQLFQGYAIARPAGAGTDTVPFTGGGRLPNFDLSLTVNTPHWKTLAASGSILGGRDDNFDEWSPAWVEIAQLSADWRPTHQVRVNPSFIHQGYWRLSDGSLVRVHRIPRLKLEYQLTRAIFFRFVGQYDSEWRDALRDDSRTGAPLLVRNSDGVYQRTTIAASNQFRHDWLFSYQPTPGTLLFAGYGSSLGADAFTLRGLERTSDGFFFKLSYLFRM
jgi:hypothetical protein